MLRKTIKIVSCVILLCIFYLFPASSHANRLIRVGIFQNYPLVFQNEEGIPQGLYVDLIKEIATQEGWDLTFVLDTWNNCLENLRNGRVDLMTNITYTKERDRYIDFSNENVLMMWGQVYVTEGVEVQNILGLEGLKIAILKGGINAINFTNLVKKFEIECDLFPVTTQKEIFEMTSSGQTDAGVLNSVFGGAHQDQYNVTLSPILFNPFKLLFATQKDKNKDMLATIDRYLVDWKKSDNSPYHKRMKQWYGSTHTEKSDLPKWIFNTLLSALLLSGFLFIWVKSLKKQVKLRTREIAEINSSLLAEIKHHSEAKNQLIENEERYKKLFQKSPSIILLIDPQNGNIIDANQKAVAFYGWGYEELIHKNISGINVLSQDQVSKAITKTREKKQDTFFFQHRLASGDVRDVGVYTNPIKITGSDYLYSIIQDITEVKKAAEVNENLESQLRQAQKMEAIGTLAGGIAHDFNNILSAILGYTELALDVVEKGMPIEEDLQEVYRGGIRAKELVAQILTFARQSNEELKPIQVDFIIKEVLKFIRSTLPTTIEINQNIESHSLIMGNPTQVHQILMNLCTNAAHAMEDAGGTLEITLNDIAIGRTTNQKRLKLQFGNYIELKVSDTGIGMRPHILEKIFEPYFTTKKPGEGTGMGLAMVHGIVDTYGGEMTVESTLGRGTVFTIYLPIAREKCAPLAYKSSELPTGQERILFVDDEVPLVKIASRVLGQLGYSVTTRTNSVDALELFRLNPDDYDLVISDVTMPQMTGDLLTKKLIDIRPDISVILCTGYTNRLSKVKASEIGVKAFTYKPIIKEDLAKTVRKVLDEVNDD